MIFIILIFIRIIYDNLLMLSIQEKNFFRVAFKAIAANLSA